MRAHPETMAASSCCDAIGRRRHSAGLATLLVASGMSRKAVPASKSGAWLLGPKKATLSCGLSALQLLRQPLETNRRLLGKVEPCVRLVPFDSGIWT